MDHLTPGKTPLKPVPGLLMIISRLMRVLVKLQVMVTLTEPQVTCRHFTFQELT